MKLTFKVIKYEARVKELTVTCNESCVHGRQPGTFAQTTHRETVEERIFSLHPHLQEEANEFWGDICVSQRGPNYTFILGQIINLSE